MTAPILLTGFGPFGDNAVNPTMLLMERMAALEGVVTGVLPVEYGTCADAFAALVERHQPAAALCFGLSARTDFILIERIAWNRDESDKPDNAGVVRDDVAIVEDGPTAYGAGVPIPALLQTLARAGLPVSFSDHAGGYVCNHLFYRARHLIETRGLDLPMAFLHVPPLPEQVADQPGRRGLPLDSLVLAARTAVAMLRRGMMGVLLA
ncbi:pyrrolidone-carboxylate peptidase [Azospirillum sp. RWY-5-1]|uniref:Pyrrolidone-carboxylate peptidase n=1 Tax=Azospirillum oleiclasticum TaxID=2735135 RepID=A0ABX2T959_9PROT|nr:pyrrolidone-carboxylate peptidase [Azospirillum oleiclasticum]NYZ20350.1 pyrrolidone-carboxylate peptidase [Azospirillum oleiclasticum]